MADVSRSHSVRKSSSEKSSRFARRQELELRVNILLDVLESFRDGDFSARMPMGLGGDFGKIAETLNEVISCTQAMSTETIRVSNAVGQEGRLNERFRMDGLSGTWAQNASAVNDLISDLVRPQVEIARVIGAVAEGNLNEKLTLNTKGDILDVKNTINTMIDTLRTFSSEVTRVAKEVGTEGKLGGQADVKGVSGTWKELTDNVNAMASNLTVQLRDVSKVATAIATGDLTQKITVNVQGEILQIKDVINRMVDTLRSFSVEVTRVAREVGTEGKLGGQADVKGVSGTWKELTDNVNAMASNLTVQLRDVSKVATAIATGDLTQKITVNVQGEILQIKDVINRMVDQLNAFAAEVTRVAREVGTEGKLGGQADVRGVSGTWKDLTENVNSLTANLTAQVRNIAKVTTAVANGDLSQKITVDVKGEILELKNTINTMVGQLSGFASEVTRVAKEVGSEGKLGVQAEVPGVSGVWKDLTVNVNAMASNLTVQLRDVSKVAFAIANGDLGQKITVDVKGEILQIKDVINKMVDQLNSFAAEVTRVAKEVGTEGRLGGQAEVKDVSGVWKDLTDNVNFMAANLTKQVRGIIKVVTSVAEGDLTQKFVLEAKGEVAALAETINSMTDTLRIFADQVTTVAREVGVEGKLGAQAKVPGVAGTWKDLTDNVNAMAANLTVQLRDVSKVATAIANGDLGQKITVDVKGEILQIKDVINKMVDTLRVFADQIITVAREVGIEGKLGGQAKVPGAAGTWKDLTDNVNQLAGNLTTQVRAIAEVATAVTKGDLTQAISVEAQGEVSQLKDNINMMIENLRDTTKANQEQDWLKSNLAKFTSMMQGLRDIQSLSKLIMSELTPVISAQHGGFFVVDGDGENKILKLISSYAYNKRRQISNRFELGEGLVGQAAVEKKHILVTDVPDDYIYIGSGLGESPPRNITVFPIVFEDQLKGVIELASFQKFSDVHLSFLEQLTQSIGVVFNMISASMRTEELLNELQRSNAQLEGRSKELEEKATLLEVKNREIARASASLEEKAKELAQISKYKSDFLANMSHELRTPLNSLLILAKMLTENENGNLTEKQVEFARTIHASGNDLLALINEILDLSKVEAGKMHLNVSDIRLVEVRDFVHRSFDPIAQQKGVKFDVRIDRNAPPMIQTDGQRVNQVLKNLLSNAFKFTERGGVTLNIALAEEDKPFINPVLQKASAIVAFHVHDTGIGIPADKQRLIFEAFQQADTTTARKYGGTGLGLTISRELARLLGGELWLQSEPGKGSTFTLYLPVEGQFLSNTRETEMFPPTPAVQVESLMAHSEVNTELAGKRVLLVDDDQRTLFAMTNLLENYKMDVTHTNNPSDAIRLIQENPEEFDLVLTDIVMPGLDGFEVSRQIRQLAGNDIKIVVFSSKAVREDMDRCKQAGCTDLITDPSDGALFINTIRRALHAGPFQAEKLQVLAPVEPKLDFSEQVLLPAEKLAGKLLQDRRVLLVDDDARNLFAVTSFLESKGAQVKAIDNAREAIDLLSQRRHDFDVVLMDIMMPDMDGYEATRQIRKIPGLEALPIIAVTAKAMTEDRTRSQKAGCTAFVPKPVNNDVLASTIYKQLEGGAIDGATR